jgi:hypothetical protein
MLAIIIGTFFFGLAMSVSSVVNAQTILSNWADTVGVTINGNSITKNASDDWGNCGAASQESFTGNGSVEFTATQADTHRSMAGLSSSNLDADYASIEYAVFLHVDGITRVFENGAYLGDFGTYQNGDTFRVERVGSAIVYKKNGVTFYTSGTPTDASLLADFAIYDNGGKISDVTLKGLDTTAPVITITGNTTIDVEYGSIYTDAGATATDTVDDDATLTASIVATGSVNTSVLGTYTITYDVTDTAGNAVQAIRTVNVVDTTVPSLTVPVDVTAEATGTDTAVTIVTAAATDAFTVTVTNDAPQHIH